MAVRTIPFPGTNDNLLNPNIVPVFELGDSIGPLVYVREKWSEAWTHNANLIPTEITWSVAPTLPVATFKAFYGDVMQPNEQSFSVVTPASITELVDRFVYVNLTATLSEGGTPSGSRRWFGIISEAHNEQGGINPTTGRAYGTITLVAYGIEKLLADHVLLKSWTENHGGFVDEVDCPIDFNRAGPRGVLGNRSDDPKVGGSYNFASKQSIAEAWSSKDILEYLIRYQTPRDQNEAVAVPFELQLPDGIPANNDTPVLKTENATTYSLISQLIDRRRCLVWWTEVDTTTNKCIVKADSIIKTPIIGNNIEVPANSSQINLQYDTDPLTNVVINTSELQKVDQVIAQGPRVRCVGTLAESDSNVEAGWSSANETTYEAGGTTHPAGTPTKRKQTRNDAARRSPELENVYSLFVIPETWDQKSRGNPLFLQDDDSTLRRQNIPELFIEQTLPLLVGEDYSGSRISAGLVSTTNDTNEEMRPFVLFKKPWTSSPNERYQNAEGSVAGVEITNSKENPRLSAHVSIPQQSRAIRIKVQGQPQHAIAFSDFSPISGEDPSVGEFDWQDAFFTVSLLSQFRTEGRYPTNENLANKSTIQRKVIYGGDQYFRDYVAPGTVVGLTEDGEIQQSATGGYIPRKGGDNDPEDYLADIAKIAAAWYCETHYVLTLESYRLKSTGDIPLGALILKAGGDPDDEDFHLEVNAPVTQITFSYPLGIDQAKPPIMKIKTWAGELDAVEFVAVKTPTLKRGKASGKETSRAMRGGGA